MAVVPHLWPPRISFKNQALSLLYLYGTLSSCKNLEKINGWSLRYLKTDRLMDRPMDGRTNKCDFIETLWINQGPNVASVVDYVLDNEVHQWLKIKRFTNTPFLLITFLGGISYSSLSQGSIILASPLKGRYMLWTKIVRKNEERKNYIDPCLLHYIEKILLVLWVNVMLLDSTKYQGEGTKQTAMTENWNDLVIKVKIILFSSLVKSVLTSLAALIDNIYLI